MDRHGHRSLIATLLLAGVLAALSRGDEARANRPDAAIGAYHITVFLPESDGSEDPNLEDWQASMVTEVTDEVLEACLFWAEQAPESAGFSCHLTYYEPAVTPTSYEPITRDGGQPLLGFWGGDEDKWINEIMDILGFSSIWLYYHDEVEDYNDWAQGEAGTDEAFSAFVVNSLADEDGSFADGSSAYVPQLRAPHLVMTWDNGGWRGVLGPDSLQSVGAHEMGHLFGAEDEYNGSNSDCTDVSNGFSNDNHEDCPGGAQTSCLMRGDYPCGQYVYPYPICFWSRGQVGWEPECPPVGRCDRSIPIACPDEMACIDDDALCDGQRDCSSASDELGCPGCDREQYRCDTGECVDDFALCECDDLDGDGYRDQACGGNDCDDSDGEVFPEAEEVCNGVDDDCDGEVDEFLDADHDGFTTCGTPADCDDGDTRIHPGARDICGDGIDQDCSGEDLACDCTDADNDGHADPSCGGDDCDDTDPSIGGSYPDCDGASGCDGGLCGDAGPPREPVEPGCSCGTAGSEASLDRWRRLLRL